jgi:glutathione peroxidase
MNGGIIMTLYDFTVIDNLGFEAPLKKYAGKVVLVVNSATHCGLTPQYADLEKLYEEYKDRGFVILEFPCNQFKEQAPESDKEIDTFCKAKYGTTYPRFQKIDVNGENTAPLYKRLKEEKPEDEPLTDLKEKGFLKIVKPLVKLTSASDIKRNFGKFLIDRNGNVVHRYAPPKKPSEIKEDIEALL